MGGENRRDSRETERVRVTVTGTDLKGASFEEQTESIELSAVGMSFHLKTAIGARTVLGIEAADSRILGHVGKIRAVVVRTETSSSEKRFVAAQFI